MADFQKIRQEIPIEKVARWLGIEVLSGKAKCPFHNDQTPSMSFKEGRFKCFGCDASGDAIDLVARLKNLSTTEAAQSIMEAFHIHNSAPVQKKSAAMNYAPISEYIDQCIGAFAVAPAAQMYLQRRGFTGESMMEFRLGFDPKRNAIVIPYGTKAEYYTARSITDKRFFKPRTEDAGPEPLFYEESLDQDAPVFVVESAFCALSIMQEGGRAVATCGTGTRKLIDALKARENVPPVIVCMDRDSAGDEAAGKLCTQLKAQGVAHLRTTTPEGYKDPNELLMGDPSLFRDWVRDCVTKAEKLPILTRRNVSQDIADTEALRALQPESNPRYLSTDIGNSRLYSDYYSGVVRYVPERKLWYIFQGKRWEPDIGGLKAMELCKKLANALMVYAFNISDEQQRKDYIDRCKKWQARRTRETILKDAQGVYPIPMDAFDRDPFLFNCQNGTIHLKDMSFQPHAPEDKITKISDVVYDPDARCERFDRFVDEIMSGDKDRARFLQRSLGYALSGDTRFECLFILYGATTRNGKGTLMESVLKVMGEYGSTVRPETISMKQNASSQNPTEDIARLAGIRFANISEPSRGLLLNAAQVKSMTGNDTLNARFLHENSFDFQPQFKIYMNTNYLPVITDMTLFSSGRIMIIPFERHFEEDQQDKSLKKTFISEKNQSAILNWLLEGYKELHLEGLTMPESVHFATERYRHESDKVGLFIEDEMEPVANAEERTSAVYDRYKKWCDANGCFAENTRNFKQILAMYGRVERKRPYAGGSETTMLIGFKLRFDTGGFTDYKGKIPFD
jgi:P4 family phage/plasmid primase-like protien